jgi:hypothetical protein
MALSEDPCDGASTRPISPAQRVHCGHPGTGYPLVQRCASFHSVNAQPRRSRAAGGGCAGEVELCHQKVDDAMCTMQDYLARNGGACPPVDWAHQTAGTAQMACSGGVCLGYNTTLSPTGAERVPADLCLRPSSAARARLPACEPSRRVQFVCTFKLLNC